jgi:hypothetical protein
MAVNRRLKPARNRARIPEVGLARTLFDSTIQCATQIWLVVTEASFMTTSLALQHRKKILSLLRTAELARLSGGRAWARAMA